MLTPTIKTKPKIGEQVPGPNPDESMVLKFNIDVGLDSVCSSLGYTEVLLTDQCYKCY